MTRYLITPGILIGIPLVLHLRRAPLWVLFIAVGLIYGALAAYDVFYVRAALDATQTGHAFTFDLLNVTPGAMINAIAFLVLAGIIGVQAHQDALLYPRLTRDLFWVLLAACLVSGARTLTLTSILQPRDGITPGWIIETAAGTVQTTLYLSFVVAAGLVVLGIWSLLRTRRQP